MDKENIYSAPFLSILMPWEPVGMPIKTLCKFPGVLASWHMQEMLKKVVNQRVHKDVTNEIVSLLCVFKEQHKADNSWISHMYGMFEVHDN